MTTESSRRDLLKTAAAAGAATAAGPAFAQAANTAPAPDPQTKYTDRPFPEQRQK